MRPNRGVFGIVCNEGTNCIQPIIAALTEQQHRGTKHWGVAVSGDDEIACFTPKGPVSALLDEKIQDIQGDIGIGHVSSCDPQPIAGYSKHGPFAVCFDGFNPAADSQRIELMSRGAFFASQEDVEVIAGFISHGLDIISGIEDAVRLIVGPCAMLVLTRNAIYAARDEYGWRPLVIGKDKGGTWVVASESCVFGSRFKLKRDVKPGEIVKIDREGLHTIRRFTDKRSYCIHEWLHFARVDSILDRIDVARLRNSLGQELAKVCGMLDIDMISPVPFAAFTYAEGVEEILRVPVVQAFHRPHHDGNYSVIPGNVLGKNILLVDNLIRSGETIKKLIDILRQANAGRVYIGIAAPPVKKDCHYSSNMTDTFLASVHRPDKVGEAIRADGFYCLNIDSLRSAFGDASKFICSKCLED